MSRIKISDRGLETVRGNGGIEHVDSNGKGFKYVVKSATWTAAGTAGDTSTGIIIPAHAVVKTLSIKPTVLAVNGGTLSGQTITDIKFGSTNIDLGSAINLFTALGNVYTYEIPSATAGQAQTALEPALTDSSPVAIQFTETNTGGYDSATDTLGAVSIVVEYVVPSH